MNLDDTTVAAQGVDESIALEHQPDAKQSDGNDTESVQTISDLEQGMELTGTVKSVTDFGAFVDLGVGPQGLVHISQLSRRRVEKVSDVVQVGDESKRLDQEG